MGNHSHLASVHPGVWDHTRAMRWRTDTIFSTREGRPTRTSLRDGGINVCPSSIFRPCDPVKLSCALEYLCRCLPVGPVKLERRVKRFVWKCLDRIVAAELRVGTAMAGQAEQIGDTYVSGRLSWNSSCLNQILRPIQSGCETRTAGLPPGRLGRRQYR